MLGSNPGFTDLLCEDDHQTQNIIKICHDHSKGWIRRTLPISQTKAYLRTVA